MRVIVCGAGQVGSSIARQLAGEANDVTVIDSDPDIARKLSETVDVRCLVGGASGSVAAPARKSAAHVALCTWASWAE